MIAAFLGLKHINSLQRLPTLDIHTGEGWLFLEKGSFGFSDDSCASSTNPTKDVVSHQYQSYGEILIYDTQVTVRY